MRIERAVDKTAYTNYNMRNTDTSFQEIFEKEAEYNQGLVPSGCREVADAWNEALRETGINPVPMNKISTALIVHVESGSKEPFSLFLGNSKESAVHRTKEIISRLKNPLLPAYDTKFANDELAFYNCFLNKLMRRSTSCGFESK